MIYSLQVERHVLSGLLKYQDLFADIDVFLSENDFFSSFVVPAPGMEASMRIPFLRLIAVLYG